MNDQLKKRLVGAVVLVSLVVIFVPMLLDGEGVSSSDGTNIPPQPDYGFRTVDIPLQLPALDVDVERRAVESVAEAKRVEPVAQQVEPAGPPAVEAVPPAVATAPAVAPAAPAAAKSRARPAPVAQAWAVQVGSFSKSVNAFGLRDRLRAKGFAAFVEQVRNDGGVIYRVRVGPELKRSNAEALMAKLEEQMKIKGLLVVHP